MTQPSPSPASQDAPPRWRGLNHLALVTNDMDATVRYYHGVLGARLVATIGTPGFRHYFFQIGAGSTVAFFEYAGAPARPFAKAAGTPDARAPQFDHVSFDVEDEQALVELQERLQAHGCDVTPVVDHGFVRSIYFTDPNGIALEASWWVKDATAGAIDYRDRALFSDTEPVAAVRELERDGVLAWTPRTGLVDAAASMADPA